MNNEPDNGCLASISYQYISLYWIGNVVKEKTYTEWFLVEFNSYLFEMFKISEIVINAISVEKEDLWTFLIYFFKFISIRNTLFKKGVLNIE